MGFFKRFRKPKAKLVLSASKSELALGDELKAALTVTSKEILDVEAIGVSLKCVENMKKTRRYQEVIEVKERRPKRDVWASDSWDVGTSRRNRPVRQETVWQEEEYWDSETLYSDDIQVSGQMQIGIGFDQSYPFVMKLPSIGRETYHSINNNLLWILNAWMKIKDRKNVFSDNYEVLVCKPSESVKEVVREVVLIPCKYCGGLMPQTAIFCPNCGARRTV